MFEINWFCLLAFAIYDIFYHFIVQHKDVNMKAPSVLFPL
jgi:hypothetical protein